MKDLYEVLEIERTSKIEEIKASYRRLAKQYHPDLNPGDKEAEKKFKEVSAAYEVLSDENKKAIYDRYGEEGLRGMASGQGGFGDFGDLGDIFSDLFDIFGGGFGRGYANEQRANYPMRGRDIRIRMQLKFKEAVFGTEKEIKITREEVCETCAGDGMKPGTKKHTCPNCNGSGQTRRVRNSLFGQMVSVETCENCNGTGEIIEEPCKDCKGIGRINKSAKIKVDIPAGVDTNSVMTLQREGNAGYNGGESGDLQIIFIVEEDEFFKREGYDIFIDIPISYTEAALGANIKVPTLTETTEYEIPSGTQSGTVFKIKNEGVKHVNSNRKGDLYFKANIEVPKKLNREEKELLEKLAKLEGENVKKRKESIFDKVKDIFDKDPN
ncbi:MAG: molecular chaperone DnaJ [Tissierellia bacterium]|nr:molecular chaperone DnaJ [Tissierellia bacterium]